MRGLLKFLNLVFVVVLLGFVRANAQEATQQSGNELQELNSHPELNLNDDKTLILDQDAKPLKPIQTKESVVVQPITNNKKSNSVDKKKEDPF
ncbi:MAG TPA: hypothetical protein DGG95_09210, partial [Cytophagales bacterium]|nr:hypothetical protein [Cytophagales bacterium]